MSPVTLKRVTVAAVRMTGPIHVDRELSRRLERTEGIVGASFCEARATTGIAADSRDFGDAIAIFDGVESPLTQSFGLGLTNTATPDTIAAVEEFFVAHGAPVMHEVSPLAGVEAYALLVERGYV